MNLTVEIKGGQSLAIGGEGEQRLTIDSKANERATDQRINRSTD